MKTAISSVLAVVTCICALAAPAASADTFTVTTTGDVVNAGDSLCSLREAVSEANSNSAGTSDCAPLVTPGNDDTIALGQGDYALNGAAEDSNLSGDLDLNLNAQTLGIGGVSATQTRLVGGGADRLIDVVSGTSRLSLDHLALTGGVSSTGFGGGAIASGPLTLTNVDVTQNQATSAVNAQQAGAGILVNSGDLSMTHSTVSNNTNSFTAGAGTADGTSLSGGGIRLATNVDATITGSTISGNSVQSANSTQFPTGAGISTSNDPGTIALLNSTISGNTLAGGASGSGAGISAPDFGASSGQLFLDNTTVSGNIITSPGGTGGGISSNPGNIFMRIHHSTFTGNTAPGGGNSLYVVDQPGNNGETDIVANVFADGANACADPSEDITAQGGNVDAGSSCHTILGSESQNVDPNLGPLADNGGPVRTHALPAGSVALDRSPACIGHTGTALPTDAREAVRAAGAGTACDAGAYERILCDGQEVKITGTDGSDSIGGTSGADVIATFGGPDTIDGGQGADRICSGAGDDTVNPGFQLGVGNIVDGGGDEDTLTYASYPSPFGGVDVDLAAGTAGGLAGGDTLSGFENVTGSPNSDRFTGTPGENEIDGLGGSDTVDYSGDTGPLTVDLSHVSGDALLGGVQDALLSIENVEGTPQDDDFVGGAGPNDFEGGDGQDWIHFDDGIGGPVDIDVPAGTSTSAAQGADTFSGIERFRGTGDADTILGSSTAEVLRGGPGPDTITGGPGADFIFGDEGEDSIFARDGVADTVDCGDDADSLETDAAGVDTIAACETVSFTPSGDGGGGGGGGGGGVIPGGTVTPPSAKCKKKKKGKKRSAATAKKKKCKKKRRKR